ncbi:SDR family oxidoreductase [Kitasatospora arboriphila]|uniref:SDR family NAD(P)-dependent oxidoreductase n=1 Tax=Kitasatospora arboriphila TaxID=258052 RepID=A0ABP4DYM2_9ACTN
MRLDGLRLLVAGATGVLGGGIALAAVEGGARVVPAGRDLQRLAEVARRLGGPPGLVFEAYDLDACRELAPAAADLLGGLDAVLVAFGVVAFGRAEDMPAPVEEHLMAVNALAPMSVLGGAVHVIGREGAIGALSGVVVDRPTPDTAAYGASKAALCGWLSTVRVEQRRNGITVLDARLPHLDTGLADRAVTGTAPRLPRGARTGPWTTAVLDGLVSGAALLVPDPATGRARLLMQEPRPTRTATPR